MASPDRRRTQTVNRRQQQQIVRREALPKMEKMHSSSRISKRTLLHLQPVSLAMVMVLRGVPRGIAQRMTVSTHAGILWKSWRMRRCVVLCLCCVVLCCVQGELTQAA